MKKLLVIEDDLELALSIRRYFLEKDIACVIVTDGQKGYRLAMKYSYNVIITDYSLPNLNGDEIVTRLRRSGIDTPVLMLTARKDPEAICNSLKYGADDYLTKPFSSIELEARVLRFISRPPTSRAERIILDNLMFDSNKGFIKYKKNEALLTKRETKLMNYLLLNRNYTVTRDRLLTNVWGDKSDLKTNTVDCYISNIRRKLGIKKDTELIKTYHGYGYMLIGELSIK